jgi:hypothetical protein
LNRTFSHLCDHLAFRSLESKPPIHLWTPSVSRTIDILIKGDGSWWHEGRKIHRKKLIKLFASILRKESNGEYHLVTPQEKWRIKVELLPLVIIAIEKTTSAIGPKLDVMLNTEEVVPINNLHKIELEERAGHIASVTLWNGLSALFNRASWYDLINLCDEDLFVESRGEKFSLLA